MDALIVRSIKGGHIERAMDLRDQLPTVCGSAHVLKKFAQGKISLEAAYARAVDSGADSVPYKKASTFRRWITDPEMDALLDNCASKVRDKLMYEFDKIATRIASLKKKHS